MAKVAPTVFFPGYASDGINITIPIASLPGLTADEAAADTGDGAEVHRALTNQVAVAYNALDEDLRPSNMTIDNPTPNGASPTTVTKTYESEFTLNIENENAVLQTDA